MREDKEKPDEFDPTLKSGIISTAIHLFLKTPQESQQRTPLELGQSHEAIARGESFATVLIDGLGDRRGAAVVQKCRREAQSHQRFGAEL